MRISDADLAAIGESERCGWGEIVTALKLDLQDAREKEKKLLLHCGNFKTQRDELRQQLDKMTAEWRKSKRALRLAAEQEAYAYSSDVDEAMKRADANEKQWIELAEVAGRA